MAKQEREGIKSIKYLKYNFINFPWENIFISKFLLGRFLFCSHLVETSKRIEDNKRFVRV